MAPFQRVFSTKKSRSESAKIEGLESKMCEHLTWENHDHFYRSEVQSVTRNQVKEKKDTVAEYTRDYRRLKLKRESIENDEQDEG